MKILGSKVWIGNTLYRIKLTKVYLEAEANQVWKGKRAGQIRDLPKLGVIAFKYRSSTLTFVKTRGANNVLIQQLEDVNSGELFLTPTAVSKVFGLNHGEIGKLAFGASGVLMFEKL